MRHVIAALWSSEVLHALRLRTASFRALCPGSDAVAFADVVAWRHGPGRSAFTLRSSWSTRWPRGRQRRFDRARRCALSRTAQVPRAMRTPQPAWIGRAGRPRRGRRDSRTEWCGRVDDDVLEGVTELRSESRDDRRRDVKAPLLRPASTNKVGPRHDEGTSGSFIVLQPAATASGATSGGRCRPLRVPKT